MDHPSSLPRDGLSASGVDIFDLSAYRWAYGWIAACCTVAAVIVFVTFPSSNSQDRAVA